MRAIKISELEAVIARINRETGNPVEPFTVTAGRSVANIGNYYLSQQYGGCAMHRMMNESGGAIDVFNFGHVPRRVLYHSLFAYIAELEAGRAPRALDQQDAQAEA